jgi:hypothetical protein
MLHNSFWCVQFNCFGLHVPGHIDHLKMRIPWKNLSSQPVVIEITGLYVLAQPRSETKVGNIPLDLLEQTPR